MRRLVFAITIFAIVAVGNSVYGVPSGITYQGKLTDSSGVPVRDGTHALIFKLYSVSTGGTPFWTFPSTDVTTSEGLFTTTIDITEKQLQTAHDVWLETVIDRTIPVTLTPRIKLLSAPFAFRSADLDLPFSGSVDNSTYAFSLSNQGSGNALNLTSYGLGNCLNGTANGDGDLINLSTDGVGRCFVASKTNSGNVIDVSTSGSGDCIHAVSTGAAGSSAGGFWLNNETSSTYAVYSQSNSTVGGMYSSALRGGSAFRGIMSGTGRAGYFTISNSTNSSEAVLGTTIGSGSALSGVTSGSGSAVSGVTTGTGSAVSGVTTGTGHAGYFEVNNAASGGNAVRAVTGGAATALYASHTASGNYAFLASNLAGVYASSNSSGGYGVYGSANSGAMYGVYGVTFTANSYALYGQGSGAGSAGVYARGGSGGFAGIFRGNVQIQDRSTGASVVELGTGLDYAEGFHVSDKQCVSPGSVLVIDAKNPGKLTLSRKAYDKKVAGIVAGAKGLGSGVKLGSTEFDRNVALAGRVYCNVDASSAAVEPGDLLTTSATPGYAMKVSDYARARGAILGKAMQPLQRGKKGQILVLVTLQ